MTAAVSRFLWNPIVAKEIRSRMRTPRTFVLLTFFLCVVGLVGLAAYAGTARSDDPTATAKAGQAFFYGVSGVVLFLLVVLVPGLTAGAISGERERQTFDLLLCTRLRPGRIVIGKLLGSLLLVLLLLVACVPLFSLAFLLGGVELRNVLIALVAAVTTTLLLGSLALLSSSVVRRTSGASVVAYLLTAVVMIGPYILGPLLLFAVSAGSPKSSSTSAMTTVFLISPSSQMTGVVEAPFSGSSTSCSETATVRSDGSTMSSRSCSEVRKRGWVLPGGVFKGWEAWKASVLIDLLLTALVLGGTTAVLGGRRHAGPGPVRAGSPAGPPAVGPPAGVPPAGVPPATGPAA